jgi:predicted permease
MFDVFNAVLPIFLLIILGCFIKNYWLNAEEFWRGLEKLAYFVLFPAALFNSISVANLSFIEQAKLILAIITSSSIISIGLMLYWRHQKLDKIQFTSVFQGSIRFNNYTFFGAGAALYGYEGMKLISIISAYMIIVTNVASVIIFNLYALESQPRSQQTSNFFNIIHKLLINPLILASLAGFIFNHFDLFIPKLFSNFLQNLASGALTIGAMTVGANLKFTWFKDFKFVILAAVCKLLLLPIITTLVLKLFDITGPARSMAILYSALPCASTSYMLSKQLGGDPESMARIITATTVLSLLFLPLVVYILN